jgi:hypothetical protein
MNKTLSLAACALLAVAASACFGFERKSTVTGPTATTVSALMGSWTSSSVLPSPSTCTDFKWNVTEQSTNRARGSFSATCANELRLSGTAEGTLVGSVVNWTADGNANAAGLVNCRITLAGTAELAGDSIRVPYSGDTCLGRVNGVEVLRRQ